MQKYFLTGVVVVFSLLTAKSNASDLVKEDFWTNCVSIYKPIIEDIIRIETKAQASDSINLSMDIPEIKKNAGYGVAVNFWAGNPKVSQKSFSGILIFRIQTSDSKVLSCSFKQALLD